MMIVEGRVGVGKDGCGLRRAKFEEFKVIQAGCAVENEKH